MSPFESYSEQLKCQVVMLDSVQLTGRFVIVARGHAASDTLMDCATEGCSGG